MSVNVSENTVVAPLWGRGDATSATLHANGRFLDIELSHSLRNITNVVTSVAFHPVDETCFVFATQAGRAYGVSLQENKLFLLVNVEEEGGGVRCATFCPGYLTSPIVIFVHGDHRLIFVDWQRGTILYDLAATMHERVICSIVTGASIDALFCTMSADRFAVWEPVVSQGDAEASERVTTSPDQQHRMVDVQASGAAATERGREVPSFAPPRYACCGSAVPTQCTRTQQQEDLGLPTQVSKTAHRFLGVHVLRPSLLLTVETNGVVSLWSRPTSGTVPEGGGYGLVPPRETSLRLYKSVAAPSVLRVRCSSTCGALVALGADAVPSCTASRAGEPAVAFVEAETLKGTGMVRLPSGVVNCSRESQTTAVTQISALHADCIACLMSTGVVHVMLPSTNHLVFSVEPSTAGLAGPRFQPHSRWSFIPSGPTFGALWREHALWLLHFPTARHYSARSGAASSDSSRNGAAGRRKGSRGPPKMSVIVAQSFISAGRSGSPTFTIERCVTDQARTDVSEAVAVLLGSRPETEIPSSGFVVTWPNVNEIDMNSTCPDAAALADHASDQRRDNASLRSTESPWMTSSHFCDTLSAVSCQHNLRRLHSHLLTYGVFPHQYRPVIWRFLAALPAKEKTLAQFAALARRPMHIAVAQLMEPYPIPKSSTRDEVELTLSCLCWASPVFTLASYLPVLVYPLVLLCCNDAQAALELTFVFFLNWGKHFFTCHPHGPATLLMKIRHQLTLFDDALAQHLDTIGAGVAVWGWELMTTLYTDVLTGAEWLQMMDHAFLNTPLWLFAFHLTFVRTRLRSRLMAAQSAEEVRSALRSVPVPAAEDANKRPRQRSLQRVIEEAYRLHAVLSSEYGDRVEAIATYRAWETFSPSFEYPTHFAHDPVILTEKLRELSLLQRSRDEAKKSAERLETLRKAAETASENEAVFLHQQRSRVAAKYSASSSSWQVHVAAEQARQATEAAERKLRWEALQQRTQNAEELNALHAEVNLIESQLRHDMVDRHMEEVKWRLSAHLTDQELLRLQRSAEAQVLRATQHIQEQEEHYQVEDEIFEAATPLEIVAPKVKRATSQLTSADHLFTVAPSSTKEPYEKMEKEPPYRCASVISPELSVTVPYPLSEETSQKEIHHRSDQENEELLEQGSRMARAHAEKASAASFSTTTITAGESAAAALPSPRPPYEDPSVMVSSGAATAVKKGDLRRETADAARTGPDNALAPPGQVKRGASVPQNSVISRRHQHHRHAALHYNSPALAQQRFLELRDRVLSRLDAYGREKSSYDPLRPPQQPKRRDDRSDTVPAHTVTTSLTAVTSSMWSTSVSDGSTTMESLPAAFSVRHQLSEHSNLSHLHAVVAPRRCRRHSTHRSTTTPLSYSRSDGGLFTSSSYGRSVSGSGYDTGSSYASYTYYSTSMSAAPTASTPSLKGGA